MREHIRAATNGLGRRCRVKTAASHQRTTPCIRQSDKLKKPEHWAGAFAKRTTKRKRLQDDRRNTGRKKDTFEEIDRIETSSEILDRKKT